MRIILLGASVLVMSGLIPRPVAQGNTQWSGVYTEEQAASGEVLYRDKCASCHGPELNGGEMAPALMGSEFTSNWNDLTLADLFERIRTTMPQNAPQSLGRADNAAILAFILKKGGYPPGAGSLPSQTEMLRIYKFMAIKP